MNTPPTGCSAMVNLGELGSRLSGGAAAPVSSGWNLWHSEREPSRRGLLSLRCQARMRFPSAETSTRNRLPRA
eukprot:6573253-Prymnesium_polylepis.1